MVCFVIIYRKVGNKMKKLIIALLVGIFSIMNIYGKDFENEFLKSFKDNDFDSCFKLLKEWERAEPDNLEINIYYFNYYFQRNAKHTMTMGQMPDGRYGLYDKVEYDLKDVEKSVSYFDKILKVQPNRFDVRANRCSVYVQTEQYDKACDALVDLIKYSKINNNDWRWSKNKTLEECGLPKGENLLFNVINECFPEICNLFEENKEGVRKLIEAELKFYPDNTWGLNHASAYYRKIGNHKKSIEILSHAVQIDPNDYILVGNLGYAYELDEDYLNAKKWYEYMLKMDDPKAVEYGKNGLKYIEGKY